MLRLALVLMTISGSAALGLHGVNALTCDRIAAAQRKALADAQKTIFPGAASFSDALLFPMTDCSGTYYEVYNAAKELVGYELLFSTPGYQSDVTVLSGIGTNGLITGIKVLGHAETPGLGAEVDAMPASESLWQAIGRLCTRRASLAAGPAVPPFQAQFVGRTIDQLDVVTPHEEGKIDAITGATITSEAVTRAVREPLDCFIECKEIPRPE